MTNHSQPLVSIILCFYNEERFIQEAIESVFHQDYPNWELIMVDDGSSDRSTQIAKVFEDEHADQCLYVEHPGHANKGLSASRNVGIKQASGEFIAFIDADDVWFPEKISQQLKIFNAHPETTVVMEASQYWRSWMGEEQDIIIPIGAKEGKYSPPQLMLKLYPLGKGAAPCPSGIMVRKDVLRRCVFEDSFTGMYQMYEDQAFLCKVYLKETVYVSEACNNRYRQRPSSLVSSVHHTGHYVQVRKFYLEWFKTYLRNHSVKHKEVEHLLNKAIREMKTSSLRLAKDDLIRWCKSILARFLVKMGLLKYHKTW